MDKWLDLIIPRGGKGLIETVVSLARMPVIKHYDGICHLYVDKAADLDMAVALTVNAKTQKPGVCNALETLLVHRDIAAEFLPKVAAALRAKDVEIRGCDETRGNLPDATPATEEDWGTEYLDLILAVKIVDSLDEAVAHINQLRLAPHRRHRHPRRGGGGALPARGRFRLRVPQRAPPASPTAASSASARKSASPPTNSTPAARWGCANSPAINTGCGATGRSRG